MIFNIFNDECLKNNSIMKLFLMINNEKFQKEIYVG